MALDAQLKDDIFRNPRTGRHHFGRHLAVCHVGDVLLAAVQEGVGTSTRIVLVVQQGDRRDFLELPLGMSYRPCLSVSSGRRAAVVWNEATDRGWEIRMADVDVEAMTVSESASVHAAPSLSLRPHAVFRDERLYIVWSQLTEENFRIHVASETAKGWHIDSECSVAGVDCFRPRVALRGDTLVCAWDRYEAPDYRVVVAERKEGAWHSIAELGESGERWFQPRLVADSSSAYVACLVVQDVVDDLGIVDHSAFATVVRCGGQDIKHLTAADQNSDPHIVADLREGLLAGEIYKGHVGLRRNPQLALSDNGDLWCLWESRRESPDSAVVARLAARRFRNGRWEDPMVLAEDGYCWSVDRRVADDQIGVASFCFTNTDRGIIQLRRLCAKGDPLEVDTEKWKRWRPASLAPPSKPDMTATFNGRACRLFWADTHVHSVLSPDAEGEVDELIHFARDVAGLDVVCLIDNDYYPHKALTEVEWRLHQAMAAHFTRSGQFVCLPGYEFTYHRTDLDPDFNHRCVIYPRRGPLLRRIDPESDTDQAMLARLKETDGMAYPHHCSYKLVDPDVEWNIEACSSWRVCLEETDFTIRQLRGGARIGFIGSSDTHRMVPGLGGARTGLWAAELTPEALFEAYRNRRCIATQGRNVAIDLRVDGHPMGAQVQASGAVDIECRVEAPIEIEWVELVRDGTTIKHVDVGRPHVRVKWTDADVPAGEHFYFVRVKQEGDASFNIEGGTGMANSLKPFSQDSRYPHNLARAEGPFAWSSPVFVTQ